MMVNALCVDQLIDLIDLKDKLIDKLLLEIDELKVRSFPSHPPSCAPFYSSLTIQSPNLFSFSLQISTHTHQIDPTIFPASL